MAGWFDKGHRQADFNEALIAAYSSLLTGAGGNASASATGAAVAAVGAVGSVFAVARPSTLAEVLTAHVLRDYAQRMLTGGNFVAILDAMELLPVSAFEVVGGGSSPSTWIYDLELPRPNGRPDKQRLPAAAVLHVKHNALPSSPWMGRSSLTGTLAATALANIERSLSLDSSIPTGGILPQPDGISPTGIAQIRAALSQGKGALTLVETTAAAFGLGKESAPRRDWQQSRFGPEIPASSVAWQDAASNAVLAALGVHPALFSGGGEGQREAHRLMVAGTCQALAALLEAELMGKAGMSMSLNFSAAQSVDLRGLGRFVGSLTGNEDNAPLADAMALAGLGRQ